MDCSIYVVRVYRREEDTSRLVGVVENTEDGRTTPFRTAEDLWRALCPVHDRRVAQRSVPGDPATKGELP